LTALTALPAYAYADAYALAAMAEKGDVENCTCAQDEEDERGDALFHQRQDNGRLGL